MKFEKLQQIAETYINGNITDAKKSIKRMSKADLIDFIGVMREFYNVPLAKIRPLVE